MKKNCKQILTIRNIINSLNDIMTGSSSIDLDSEVIIANARTLEEFDNIRIYPIRDVFYGQDKVGIYIEPKQEQEMSFEEQSEIIKRHMLDKEEPVQEVQEEQEIQETTKNNNWWEKYK